MERRSAAGRLSRQSFLEFWRPMTPMAPGAVHHPEHRTAPSGPARSGAVAIVGMACRFPGGGGLEGFRDLLRSGGDAVEEGEPGSGAGRVGRLFKDRRPLPDPRRYGAFVEGFDRFDAAFFGIPDGEARLMDPQHRLLLETSWSALEHAGIAPDTLSGSRTGVFAGIGHSGYRDLFSADEAESIYAATGNSASAAVGRIGFALGLEGPAIAVDTASSSSLVAVHQAVLALQRGEADLALAGGANLILSPVRTEMYANGGMLAADGRCRSFAAAAQGYVRGEGCGIVALEPLELAEVSGRRILGVVRGSAVNQDGASAGLTVPSGPAQERLIEAALARAGWDPSEVDYLEGHGSGTPLGDPVEVEAALRVYGRGRPPDRPLLLGSVKTNVGHLEAASGVAGLIKAVLALEAGEIPRQLHFDAPNPRIAWRDLPVRVVSEPTSWPRRTGRGMRAGVSSFGLSGTNAHVLVEGYPPPAEPADADDRTGGALALALSARTPEALRRLGGRYRTWLEGCRGSSALRDLAWTAAVGRSRFEYRAALPFRDRAELVSALIRLEAGERGVRAEASPKAAFVFPGWSGQWAGIGRTLHRSEPAIRETLDVCDAVFREETGHGLLPAMFGEAGAAGDLDRAEWAQPALYALGCALAAFWRKAGLLPSAVFGHGVGEVAAAQSAGMLGLEDGMLFAIQRGRWLATAPEYPDEAGAPQGGQAHGVAPPDAVLDEVELAGGALRLGAASVPLVGALTGEVLGGPDELDGTYWRRQMQREPRFAGAAETLCSLGIRVLVDMGPRGGTASRAGGVWPSGVPRPLLVPTLAGPSSAGEGAAEALSRAWEAGAPVSLVPLFGEEGGRLVSVPGYPFEGRRHWVGEEDDAPPSEEPVVGRPWEGDGSEPVLAQRLETFLKREIRDLARLEAIPSGDAGFLELGLQSLQLAELRNRLNRRLGGAYRVSEAEMFSHPDAAKLAAHAAEQAGGPSRRGRMELAISRSRRLRAGEPIAVVGMSCRFPGGGGVEDFWRRLAGGEDLVTRGRPDGDLPGLGGRESEMWGAYLPGLDRFDAEFFRIAPVEAELLDPQQRLLLVASWEALEDAGIAPASLKGSRTGVYAGMFASDYQSLVSEAAPGLYRSTGSSFSAAIGRVAYTLGLEGPAIAVDTACSASLVALHQAAAALDRGEVDLALAGGVNAVLTCSLTDAFEAAGMLAPDGRCKTFDASADGYVRGEGCGMLALMRLSRARADGHRILGLVLGSAVNQDGRSAGLTAPNGLAQERLIAEALSRAGVEPSSVDYLEAHGTGTPLGDPVELEAAAAAYGRGRDPGHPLLVGSVKTNMGHLEAAAGVAGVIKVLLAMREGMIPRHLHFAKPNPRLDWDGLPLSVAAEAVAWTEGDGRPRRAGVSSFGYSGTNAHVVLEACAEDRGALPVSGGQRSSQDGEARSDRSVHRLLPLSGRTEKAVRELARRYRDRLNETEFPESWLADAAWTAGTGRDHFGRRAVAVFRDAGSLRTGLERILETGQGIGTAREGRTVFLYTGQGSQWAGMGRDLYGSEPAFREALDRCEAVFRAERGESLIAAMFGDPGRLDRTEWAQPALYALGAALTALWAGVGVRPDVVFGHSVGEIAAAAAAGAFDLEEGMRFAVRRGALMGSLPAGGAMAAVFAAPGRVAERLSGSVSLAADNGAHQVVSGPEEEVSALLEAFRSESVRVERLRTSHGFHSLLVAPILDELESVAPEASAMSVPLVSNVGGRLFEGVPDGAYWRRQAREPVAFGATLATLAEMDVRLLVELGPHPVLGPMAGLAWPVSGSPDIVASQQREGSGDFASAVGAAYMAGAPVAFAGLFRGESRRRISLPTYPFEQERHWTRTTGRRSPGIAHGLPGVRRDSLGGEVSFEAELFGDDPLWLGDQRMFGEVVAPASLFAVLAIEAFRQAERPRAGSLEDTSIHRPLVLPAEEGRTVQVVVSTDDRWKVISRADKGAAWELNAEGRAAPAPRDGDSLGDLTFRDRLPATEPNELYDLFSAKGADYGPVFRLLVDVRFGSGFGVGELSLPEKSDKQLGLAALLDGGFQLLAGAAARAAEGVEASAEEQAVCFPVGWERLWVREPLPGRVVCSVRVRSAETDACSGDITFSAVGGDLLGGIEGLALKQASRSALFGSKVEDLLYEIEWKESRPVGVGSLPLSRGPETIASGMPPAVRYLEEEGLNPERLRALGRVLEKEACRYALAALRDLGWEPKAGERFQEDGLRRRLNVTGDYRRLFGRLLVLLQEAGLVSREPADIWTVTGDSEDLHPDHPTAGESSSEFAQQRLLRRCAPSLAEVLRGRSNPQELLFGEDQAAAEFYRDWKPALAASRMAGDALQAALSGFPEDRGLRILEVGAGTGATTAEILRRLPAERTVYEFTDISAAFFTSAKVRFDGSEVDMRYSALNIENDPAEQGFAVHRYDFVIAANVLHATRDLLGTLANCRRLLAPGGLLVAVEGTAAEGWLDLTFGLLSGWWRFEDEVRSGHALAGPDIWRRALLDSGFAETAFLGQELGQMVILARAPSEIEVDPGLFVLAGGGAVAAELGREMRRRRQTVVSGPSDGDRVSWRSFFEDLPGDAPFRGVVHMGGVRSDGSELSAAGLRGELEAVGADAIAMTQGLADTGIRPKSGIWFVTRGGQVVDRETSGALAGSLLWGFGSVVGLEHGDLNPRLVDLDPEAGVQVEALAEELLFPDRETRIAWRHGRRQAARLARIGRNTELPEGSSWRLVPDTAESPCPLRVEKTVVSGPGPREVRVAVEAAGLDYHDVLAGLRLVDSDRPLGLEICGRILECGPGATGFGEGERVVGFAPGAFSPEVVTRDALVAAAPAGFSSAELATLPSAFLMAMLAFGSAELGKGSRVLIHAGTGGVGRAAIQLALAAGFEVHATASAPKQAVLRSLGVSGVYGSRDTGFGKRVLEATGGCGVDIVLNSLTGEGFIEAGLSCLAHGGAFVEIGERGIWSSGRMREARPDVAYRVLALDRLVAEDPEMAGGLLRKLLARVASGELTPLPLTRWPLLEAGEAMRHMRTARHMGKTVLFPSALAVGRLRSDRSYLVTGGLGGIGLAVAERLARWGAGAVVLNGRRPPDDRARAAVEALREHGTEIRVEISDVTSEEAVEGMLQRIGAALPPLGGVVHSVGVLSDGALANQDWGRFEKVLWPKILGAWRLHRATLGMELDLFVMFSSVAGVLGVPGQANHAAANAFLDQLARHRRALGLCGQAIAWGTWSDIGEAEEQRDRISGSKARKGEGWIAPADGLAAFSRLLREDIGSSLAASMEWDALAPSAPFLEHLVETDPVQPVLRSSIGGRLNSLPATERQEALLSCVLDELAKVLGLRSVPSPKVGFFELGMDSLMAVEFRNRLNRAFSGAIVVSNTAVFDHPDAARFAAHLAAQFEDAPPAARSGTRRLAPDPVKSRESDRIAIIGMACRFPGGPDLPSFWEQLLSGGDAVTHGRPDGLFVDPETEAARFPGAYVEGIDRFDAGFFRIAPVEAEFLDPQQRMLLETSWAALEDAGVDPGGLRGSPTAVYGGICGNDYQSLVAASRTGASRNLYRSTGVSAATAVGRVAFALGLMGPAITVDTACSSSLVAVHQAAVALLRGEADLAIAGGANAILSVATTRLLEDGGMLAPDGRCKTFDAAADGFGRGEGCGMVVLKRLSDAEAAGDRILGVLLGSAVNQDGASAGLTVPNGVAQERVIEEALERAGIAPSTVDYLEAHGTGTELGDPVEVEAAASVYGRGRDADRPLLIGSVKTNIGHLEAAAGVAGLIKTVLALRAGTIPRHLHFTCPNPRLEWGRLPVRVTAEATPWPGTGGPRRAAVSSFGYSGTNAHVVIEEYPVAIESPPGDGTPVPMRERLLPLSARTAAAVRELAGRYRDWLGDGDIAPAGLADAAWTASTGRSHFGSRVAIAFSDADELRSQLESAAVPERSVVSEDRGQRIAFLYTGQGSQWAGMGRDLYETEPEFRAVLDRCDEIMREERDASLLPVMFGASQGLDRTEWAQPALYALESALTALWASVGVRPDVVFGHSVGEIAAAAAVGAFDLEDGMRFAVRRGALIGSLPPGGSMAAVFAPPERVAAALQGSVSLAADNGAHQVVSGPEDAVRALMEEFESSGAKAQLLRTSHAFHSSLMDPVLDELEASAGQVSPPAIPMVTGLGGRLLEGSTDGAYWRRQAREPVRFGAAVRTLSELGAGVLVELGPHAVLGPTAMLAWPRPNAPVAVSSQKMGGAGTFVAAVGEAYEAGIEIAFEGLFAGERRRSVSLPTYPFQRERYWVEGATRRNGREHPLLGARRELPREEASFLLDSCDLPWLRDHRAFGQVLATAELFGAQALAAAFRENCADAPLGEVVARDVRIEKPLLLSEEETGTPYAKAGRELQFMLRGEKSPSSRVWEVFSRDPDGSWELHAEGRLESPKYGGIGNLPSAQVDQMKAGLAPVDVQDLYRAFAASGLNCGPAFRGIGRLWRGEHEAVGEVALPAGIEDSGSPIHPVLLGACFQVALSAEIPVADGADELWIPVGWKELRLAVNPPNRIVCHARLSVSGSDTDVMAGTRCFDLSLYALDGESVGAAIGLAFQRTARSAFSRSGASVGELLYQVEWREEKARARPGKYPASGPGIWLIAAPGSAAVAEAAESLAAALRAGLQTVIVAADADAGLEGAAAEEASSRESWHSLFQGLSRDLPLRGVVHLSGIEGSGPWADSDDLGRELKTVAGSALAMTQGLLDADRTPTGGIWFVTRGGQAVGREVRGALAGASVWGFARSAVLETGDIEVRLIDLDPDASASMGLLAEELLRPDRETEVAYRDDRRRVARLVRRRERALQFGDCDWRLARNSDGMLDPLSVEKAPRTALGPGEVRVAVEAACLSDGDALEGQGLVDRDAPLGTEFSGRIIEVGQGVEGLSEGDRVVGFASGTFGPEAVASAECLALAPPGHSAAALATLPAAFVAARLAFDLAEMESGGRVLVHAVTGGVELAAVQLAKSADLKVFAAASAPDLECLRTFPLDAMLDSRSPTLGKEVLEAAGGLGMDMVMNGLIGEGSIESSLESLAPGGAFVELGKPDVWNREAVRAARPDVRYHVLDLDRLVRQEPRRIGAVLRAMLDKMATGALSPLPHTRWPLLEAASAMEYMRAGSQPGKVVLAPSAFARNRLREDRSYLVTGGFGGLGLQVAAWLSRSGAGAVVLNGRRAPDPAAARDIAMLKEKGFAIGEEIADVADETAVATMFARMETDSALPPLGGVIHCAGTLADGALVNQKWEGFERVLKPKAFGAWNLHRATEGMDLDLFVLFTGLAGVLGNAGQTNYGAANAFLDRLALHRRAHGLPGQAIAWGAWSDAGAAAEKRDLIWRQLEAGGTGWMSTEEGLEAFSLLLFEDAAAAMVSRMDWATRQTMLRSPPPLLEEVRVVLDAPVGVEHVSEGDALMSRLEQAGHAEAGSILREFIQEELTELLHLSHRPSTRTGFFELGMDSVMAVELRNRLRRAFGGKLAVSNTVALDHPNVEKLAKHLAVALGLATDEAQTTSPDEAFHDGSDDWVAEILNELEKDGG